MVSMADLKLISDASEIVLPDTFKCPICGAAIYIEDVDAWEDDDDGNTVAETVQIDCTTFPGFDDTDAFNAYMRGHWHTPYVDWMPLQDTVTRWVNGRYKWDL
jgi:hypothetical protein